jgi:uncharacterized repeat protein (TIGR01451 family)
MSPTALPSSVDLEIQLSVAGDQPKVGASITFTIQITNPSATQSVDHINVWDTLPSEVVFDSTTLTSGFTQSGNVLSWDLTTDPSTGGPYVLPPGGSIYIDYTVTLTQASPNMAPFWNKASVDYNDPHYMAGGALGKHPPVTSDASFYPLAKPVVFPNPYNPDKDGNIKFVNIVPGSSIEIFTISGEMVRVIPPSTLLRAEWDGRNSNGNPVSKGIYYFIIKDQTSGQVLKGKIFVVSK